MRFVVYMLAVCGEQAIGFSKPLLDVLENLPSGAQAYRAFIAYRSPAAKLVRRDLAHSAELGRRGEHVAAAGHGPDMVEEPAVRSHTVAGKEARVDQAKT